MLMCATAPGSWGVENPGDPNNPPWQRVLDEIAAAGYAGTELGPLGYLPEDASILRRQLNQRRLAMSAGYLMEALDDAGQIDRITRKAETTCALLSGVGARYLVVICGLTQERMSTAGRSSAAARVDPHIWPVLVESVNRVARIAHRFNLRAAFHPHVGTAIEFEDEIERLLRDTDREWVGLCLDTGHSVYAGIDPTELCRRHAGRLAYVHLKDVNPGVLERSIARELPFFAAVGEHLFCPLGQGAVDFGAFAEALHDVGYNDWATVEQDRLATDSNSPLEDASESLRYLIEVGLAAEPQRRKA